MLLICHVNIIQVMKMNVAVYGLVILAILVASTSGQTYAFIVGTAICSGCFRSANDCDWAAGAVNISTPRLTPSGDEGCAVICLVNTACTHYTFTVSLASSPSIGYCILKKASASVIPIAAFGPSGIGSSCGWMFFRSPQASPPGFIARNSSTSALFKDTDDGQVNGLVSLV